jgi:hypothetical protein
MTIKTDDLVVELAERMEVINIPSDVVDCEPGIRAETMDMSCLPSHGGESDVTTERRDHVKNASIPEARQPLVTPDTNSRRPFDDLVDAGSPADPIDFPEPRFERGRRHEVVCYIPASDTHQVLKNVLFRDFTREYPDDGDARLQQAYYPIPHKHPIKTIMGHVEICMLLTRCQKSDGDDDDDSESYEDDGDEDVVFELTTTCVAVKVNYCDRMERMRNQHAEDPLKEIAAMQLIGNNHPNVLGCIEVLFDGQNLNIVLPYCDRGDLFQLLQESQHTATPDCPGMSEGQARYWFRQVMAGVKHIHESGVCHRDLSPENVMIDDKRSIIIDMGMCLRVPYTDPHLMERVTDVQKGSNKRLFKPQGACGKLPYMSPEIYRNRDPFDGAAADVWTAGTILFCMVTGNRSYQRPHRSDPQFYWMSRGLSQLLKDWQVSLSMEGLHLLQNMLQVDPRLRLTIDEVVHHPWFTYPDDTLLPR